MRLIFFVLLFLTPAVFAQDAPKASPAPTPTPALKIEDAKPIIVTKDKILTSENLALRLQNAQLQAQAAIPAELKKAIDDAQKALDEYYAKEIGVSRDKLSEYEISNGLDGALILRKKATPPPPEKKQ